MASSSNYHKKRQNSSIYKIRQFHNWIKNKLFVESINYLNDNEIKDKKLLELAVGKGGDMHKWYNSSIYEMVGFDISDESINGKDGAIDRFKSQHYRIRPNYNYFVLDLSDHNNHELLDNLILKTKINNFTICSCQFALHYFFKNKSTLESILTIISKYLENGGIFIGTTLDGTLIKKLLNSDGFFSNSICEFKKINDTTYEVQLGERGEDHYFASKPSTEYFVDTDYLKEMADKFNLQFISYLNFEDWYSEYEKDPKFQKSNALGSDEKTYSFVNFSFCFIKKN